MPGCRSDVVPVVPFQTHVDIMGSDHRPVSSGFQLQLRLPYVRVAAACGLCVVLGLCLGCAWVVLVISCLHLILHVGFFHVGIHERID